VHQQPLMFAHLLRLARGARGLAAKREEEKEQREEREEVKGKRDEPQPPQERSVSSTALAPSAAAPKREGGEHTRECAFAVEAQRKELWDTREEQQRSSSSSSAHAHVRAAGGGTLSVGARHPLVPALKGLPTGGEFAQTSSAPPASAEAPPSLKSGGAAVTSSETRLLLCANSDSLYNGSSAGEFVHTRRRPQGTPEDTPPTLGGAEGEVLQGRMR
jgi:hypothetical protein